VTIGRPRHIKGRALPRRGGAGRFVVVTGLSGAGKSHAIRALEDLGYFCVDNLPIKLIPTFAQLTLRAGSEIARAAVVVDVREGSFLSEFPRIYRQLRRVPGLNPQLIFLEANEASLVRRFSETRRPHPLAPDRPVVAGIRRERSRLRPIRRMADRTIDTSEMTVHDLRRAFTIWSKTQPRRQPLVVTFVSFGFKHGLPLEVDLLFDVRFLPNPHFVPRLRGKTGRDRSVVRFLDRSPVTGELVARTLDLLRFLIPHVREEGKRYLTIGVGCTGGRHRSVAIAGAMARGLGRTPGLVVRVHHRDVGVA
jgi:UPF0042 nucleotide-binding protein